MPGGALEAETAVRMAALIVLAAAPACGQTLSLGMKAVVAATALMGADAPMYRSATRRYTLGPAVEVKLPRRFSVGVDALYKRVEWAGPTPTRGRPAEAGRWEFPVLVKRSFSGGRARPFAALGISFNRVTGVRGAAAFTELRHRSTIGYAAAAGVELRLGILRIVPEIRFTRWVDRNFGVRDGPLRSNLSQVEVLAGLML